MATKKQKRAAGLAKHEAFMAEVRRTGLAEQQKDVRRREARKAQKEADERAAAEKRHQERLSQEARPLVATFGLTEEDAKRIVQQVRRESPDNISDRAFAVAVGARVREEYLANMLDTPIDVTRVDNEEECI